MTSPTRTEEIQGKVTVCRVGLERCFLSEREREKKVCRGLAVRPLEVLRKEYPDRLRKQWKETGWRL